MYTALTEIGESSIGNLLKISKVSHSKIYDILERLAQKGLVSVINQNGKQYFSAADPARLIELVHEKKEELDAQQKELKQIAKSLRVRKKTRRTESILSSYQGIKGIKTILDYILQKLSKDDEVLIVGTPRKINEYAGGYIKAWQQERIDRGARCRLLTDQDTISWDFPWWEKSKKEKKTLTRRSTMSSPAYLVITKNTVATIYFSGAILGVLVEHPEIAERYHAFFEILWKAAR